MAMLSPDAVPTDVTELLIAWRSGDATAQPRLLQIVQEELRGIADRELARETSDTTLSTTALVQEAYLKLADQRRMAWNDRAHFYSVAARAVRRVLVDRVRQRHDAGETKVAAPSAEAIERAVREESPLLPVPVSRDGPDELLLALDRALEQLSAVDDRLTQVVECRFFAGLSEADTGAALGITERNVRREWAKARSLLYSALREGASE
jgi:RNA polymerase sigma factor (TIGR02999 family)